MYVGMRNFHPQHGHTYALAGNSRLDGQCDLAGKSPKAVVCGLVEVEDIVVLNILGDDKGMPFSEGVNIQKGVELIVLRHFP